jgi:hypothetical protein
MTKLSVTPGGVSVAAVQQQMERQRWEARHAPRMIFSMDATASRSPTWEVASKLQREMGAALGSLTLQLVFFRAAECKASKWVMGGQRLAELMTTVRCVTGLTQIAKVLRHALGESSEHTIRALVYVGDDCEESADELCALAGQLKQQRVPIFLFHEIADPGKNRDVGAAPIFRRLAEITDGIYAVFDAGSAEQLGRLLTGAAEYAVGKHESIGVLRNTLLLGRS